MIKQLLIALALILIISLSAALDLFKNHGPDILMILSFVMAISIVMITAFTFIG